MSSLLAEVSSFAGALLLALVTAVALCLVMWTHRFVAARGRQWLLSIVAGFEFLRRSARSGRTAPPDGGEARVRRLKLEMYDLGRQLDARLDTKLTSLNQVLRDLDSRIAELKRLLSTRGGPGSLTAQQSPTESSTTPGRDRATDAPRDIVATAPSQSVRPDPPQPLKPNRPRPTPGDRQAVVYELAAEGLDAEQIAVRTRIPKGEVQLILGLRREASLNSQPAAADAGRSVPHAHSPGT